MTRPHPLVPLAALAAAVLALPPAGATAGARGGETAAALTDGSRAALAGAAALVGVAAGAAAGAPGAAPAASTMTAAPSADAAARGRSPSGAAHGRARWRWPLLPRPRLLRPFAAPLSTYGRGHRGLDLAADAGAPVLAVEGGVVTHAGVVAGRGTITVQHPDGVSSTYEPTVPAVGAGVTVTVGELLGTVGARAGPSHCGARACLHLGARRGDAYLDPYPLLVAGRVRLLPLG